MLGGESVGWWRGQDAVPLTPVPDRRAKQGPNVNAVMVWTQALCPAPERPLCGRTRPGGAPLGMPDAHARHRTICAASAPGQPHHLIISYITGQRSVEWG